MKVVHAVGARPNFVKIAPIVWAMTARPAEFQQILVHTGQHYDDNMAGVFIKELGLPPPDVSLGIGSGTHAEQTARVMLGLEPVLARHRPDWVIVVGDVNSTLACALTAVKLGIPVAHVEAGLRSFDRTMPEEHNRRLTDQLAELLFTHSPDATFNLLREATPPERIHFVGNVMIDTLTRLLPQTAGRRILSDLGLANGHVGHAVRHAAPYLLVTLHRPFNVDDPAPLREILGALRVISRDWPVVFPVHPRARGRLVDCALAGDDTAPDGLQLIDPLGYLDFLTLERHAAAVLTDSGGIQEETTYLGIPCLTVRPNTERPVTISCGTNRLVPADRAALVPAVRAAMRDGPRPTRRPELWDGHAAERIVETLRRAGPASRA
jgi:UDP-N-acetylglucosamine 2-epimerase (non-hydrolysing)